MQVGQIHICQGSLCAHLHACLAGGRWVGGCHPLFFVMQCLSFTKCFLGGNGSVSAAGMEMTATFTDCVEKKKKKRGAPSRDLRGRGETLHGKRWGWAAGVFFDKPYKEMEKSVEGGAWRLLISCC